MSGREEAAFLRGDVGVDGAAVEEEKDAAQVERQKVVEQLLRGRTYLGREFLTWLLWRSNSGGPITDVDDEPVSALFVGKVVLRGLAGDANELVVKGGMSAYSSVVRHAVDQGLLVHAARLRLQHGERALEVTVDAEHLDFRAAQIPKVLSEEDDDKLAERLWLCELLGRIVDALLGEFLKVRTSRRWKSKVVPSMKAWLREES